MQSLKDDKVWSKIGSGVDIHGDPLIQKYATMDAVITVTKNVKRTRNASSGAEVNYSGNAIKNGHNHH